MRWAIAIPTMFAVALVQVAVLDQALLAGQVRLDLPLYLVVAVGLSSRSSSAALAGFALGVIVDLFQFGPFGVHAMIYCVAGWVLAESRERVLQEGVGFSVMQGTLATLAVTGLTWLLGAVFGLRPLALNQGPWRVLVNLAMIGLFGGIAVGPMTRLAHMMSVGFSAGREQHPVRI
jgi:rod shape-determining protein MreD